MTGAMSVTVALLLPEGADNWLAGAPGMAYAAMALTGAVMTLAEKRWRARIEAELA